MGDSQTRAAKCMHGNANVPTLYRYCRYGTATENMLEYLLSSMLECMLAQYCNIGQYRYGKVLETSAKFHAFKMTL